MADRDVIVVGARPAGLSAATVLARAGRQVVVLEREVEAGGIPRHCGHYPFGMREFHRILRGPDYAARLRKAAIGAGVTIRTQTTVTALLPGGTVAITDDTGLSSLSAKAVLLATGVRETSRAARLIGGDKPGGVMSTAALQGMIYLNGQRPFQRPVILGTELVAFSALLTCRHAGIRPVAMIELGARITAMSPAVWLARLMGVPIRLRSACTAIHGGARVTGVTVSGPSGPEELAADGVIVSGGFRPDAALLRGSHLAVDPASGGPVIDQWGRLDDPAYFAAGNLLRGVETAGWCWAEGARTAGAILAALDGGLPATAGVRLHLGHSALKLALPQVIGGPATGAVHDHLQLRLTKAANGRLRLMQDGQELASQRVNALPERRLTMPLPAVTGQGALTLILDEVP